MYTRIEPLSQTEPEWAQRSFENAMLKMVIKLAVVFSIALVCDAEAQTLPPNPCGSPTEIPANEMFFGSARIITCLGSALYVGPVTELIAIDQNNNVTAQMMLFDTNQYETLKKHFENDQHLKFNHTMEQWTTATGTTLHTEVVTFKASNGIIEIHQMYRKFGQAAFGYNFKEIEKSGVLSNIR